MNNLPLLRLMIAIKQILPCLNTMASLSMLTPSTLLSVQGLVKYLFESMKQTGAS
jgi:hypothetical protein